MEEQLPCRLIALSITLLLARRLLSRLAGRRNGALARGISRTMTGPIFRYPSATRDSLYVFQLVHYDSELRIVILLQPSYQTYGRRNEGPEATHRLGHIQGNYVCFTGTIPTETAAKLVAIRWAEGTESYRKEGRFEPPDYPWALQRLAELPG